MFTQPVLWSRLVLLTCDQPTLPRRHWRLVLCLHGSKRSISQITSNCNVTHCIVHRPPHSLLREINKQCSKCRNSSKVSNIFLFPSLASSLINCTLADIYCSWWVVPHRFNTFEASNWLVRSSRRDDTYDTIHYRMRTCRSCTPSIAVRSSLSASSARFHCKQNMNDAKGFLHSNSHCSPSSAGFKISQTVRKPIVLAILCRKVHEIEKKNWIQEGRAPLQIRHWHPLVESDTLNSFQNVCPDSATSIKNKSDVINRSFRESKLLEVDTRTMQTH